MTYDIDTSTIGGAVDAFVELALGSLGLRQAAFATVDRSTDAADVVIVIVLVAGVSQLLGQSVVLFLNGVRPLRFALSLLLAAVVFLAGVAVFAVAVWAAAALVVAEDVSLSRAAAVVALGHTPYLLSFFVLLPYCGPGLDRVLGIWTVACIAVGLRATFAFGLIEVLLAIGVGFAFVQVARLLVGRWVGQGVDLLRRRVAGGAPVLSVENVVESVEEQADRDARRWFDP